VATAAVLDELCSSALRKCERVCRLAVERVPKPMRMPCTVHKSGEPGNSGGGSEEVGRRPPTKRVLYGERYAEADVAVSGNRESVINE